MQLEMSSAVVLCSDQLLIRCICSHFSCTDRNVFRLYFISKCYRNNEINILVVKRIHEVSLSEKYVYCGFCISLDFIDGSIDTVELWT